MTTVSSFQLLKRYRLKQKKRMVPTHITVTGLLIGKSPEPCSESDGLRQVLLKGDGNTVVLSSVF